MLLVLVVATSQAFVSAPCHFYSQAHHQPRLYCTLCLLSMKDNVSTTPQDGNSIHPKHQRRRTKKNKYEKFSKVNIDAPDPLERLIAESERKNAEWQLEVGMKKKNNKNKNKHNQSTEEAATAAVTQSLPPMTFPDTSHIDPYDPTTFGYTEIGQIVGAHGVAGWLKLHSKSDVAKEHLCLTATAAANNNNNNNNIRHIKPANKRAPRPVTLLQGKQHRVNHEYLIQLAGVEDRTTALTYRGATLYVRQEQESPAAVVSPQEEEYLVADLVGLEVFLVQSDDNDDHNKHTKNGDSSDYDDDDDDDDYKSFVGTVGGIVFAEDLCNNIPNMPPMHDYLEIVIPRGRQDGMASFRDELVLIPFVPAIVPVVNIAQREIYIDPPAGLLDLTYVRQDKTRIKGFLPGSKSEN